MADVHTVAALALHGGPEAKDILERLSAFETVTEAEAQSVLADLNAAMAERRKKKDQQERIKFVGYWRIVCFECHMPSDMSAIPAKVKRKLYNRCHKDKARGHHVGNYSEARGNDRTRFVTIRNTPEGRRVLNDLIDGGQVELVIPRYGRGGWKSGPHVQGPIEKEQGAGRFGRARRSPVPVGTTARQILDRCVAAARRQKNEEN